MAATPLSPASPEEAPPLPVLRPGDSKDRSIGGAVGGAAEGGGGGGGGIGDGRVGLGVAGVDPGIVGKAGLEIRLREEPAPPHPWEKPEENRGDTRGDTPNEVRFKETKND